MRAKKRATVIYKLQTIMAKAFDANAYIAHAFDPHASIRTFLTRTSYTLVSKKNTRLTRFEIRMCFLQNV